MTGEVVVELPEPLSADRADAVTAALERAGGGAAAVRVSLAAIRTADTFGLAALAGAVRALRARGRTVQVVDLGPDVRRRAELLRLDEVLADGGGDAPPPAATFLARVAASLDGFVALLATLYAGFRHAAADCLSTPLGREQAARQLDQIGARAVPIVATVTFLVGAIMALQTAYVVAPYGGSIYVARGVAISLVRELGPLMAAILLAGRSGSAIAAELGAMVVYEEVDALEMMALRPGRFLVSPRFAALCFAAPALALLADVCGIAGGALVMTLGYDVPAPTYIDRSIDGIYGRDLASGLIKSVFFGALVAAVACRRGLALRGGPEAVGRAATAAVVDSILAVIVFDAAFTMATHRFL